MNIFKYEVEDGIAESVAKANSLAFNSSINIKDMPKDVLEKAISMQFTPVNQIDLFYFESILASAGWNKNDDVFEIEELIKARFTPVNKPVNFMHNEKDIIGHMTSSILLSDGSVVGEDMQSLSNLDVIVGSVLYKYWEEEEQRNRVTSIIKEIAEGKWCVSMECIFPHFDYAVIGPDGSNKIVARNDETSFLTKYLKVFGGKGEYKGYRIGRLLRDFTFSGKGIVDNPANPRSIITDYKAESFYGAAASIQEIETNVEKEMSKEIETVAKADYDNLVEELKSLKAQAAEKAQKEVDEKIKSIAADLDAHKEIIKGKDTNIQSLTEQLNTTKAELEVVKSELTTEKLNVVKASRLAKLLEKGVSEDRAKSLSEKFASISEELFNELVDSFPTEAKKDEEDMEKEECAKKEKEEAAKKEKEATEAATKALEAAKSSEIPGSIPNADKANELSAKASAWLKNSVDSVIPEKKNK